MAAGALPPHDAAALVRKGLSGQSGSGEVGKMWAGRVLHAALSGASRDRRAQSALAQLRGILKEELESIRKAGTWKSERVITSSQGPHIHVDGAPGGNSPHLRIARPGRGFGGPS